LGFKPGRHIPTKSIGWQEVGVKHFFPQFNYKWVGKHGVWTGTLRPCPKSPEYEIKIDYHLGYRPRVFILSPAIAEDAPHRFKDDKSLCLYFPEDGSWSSAKFIADTILPWTAEWLRFYEIWVVTEIWFGPEAPHTPNK
jgi:hypothetical protein